MALVIAAGLAACGAKNEKTAKPFKAGVWSVLKDGEEVATYTFTENMKECAYDSAVSGLAFDYEIDGSTYIFHFGSADEASKATAVFADDDNCTLTWEEPAREEVLRFKGAVSGSEKADTEENEAEMDIPRLIINSEPVFVTAEDGFDNAGVTACICDATAKYSFKANSDVDWKVFVLDKKFEDGARYLTQSRTPDLIGNGVLDINEGSYIYIVCGENAFTADAPSDAKLAIDYAQGLTGAYQDSVSQRASAEVIDSSDGVNIIVHWGGSATEAYNWTMNCTREGDKLTYKDCKKIYLNLDPANEKREVEYENGEGYFTIKDGKLLWDGAAEEDCAGCVFEPLTQA